ncbi:MAG: DUF4058 family protein, partial [Anaerolineae bacterium]|nr:DUF4058 family protein [Anaerolineae bacterium]
MGRKNLYRGVNAHLMSCLQGEPEYRAFYTVFLVKLMLSLNSFLPDHYRARLDDGACPSVSSHNGRFYPGGIKTNFDEVLVAQPDFYVPVAKAEASPLAVVIGEINNSRPVTRIELLSPREKTLEGNRTDYREKRMQVLRSGVALVEIDLLHETRPMLYSLPRYPTDPGSMAYYIAVTDPRTSDKTAIYRFGINQPIPVINLPMLYGTMLPYD